MITVSSVRTTSVVRWLDGRVTREHEEPGVEQAAMLLDRYLVLLIKRGDAEPFLRLLDHTGAVLGDIHAPDGHRFYYLPGYDEQTDLVVVSDLRENGVDWHYQIDPTNLMIKRGSMAR